MLKRRRKVSADGSFLRTHHLPVSLRCLKKETEAQSAEGSGRGQHAASGSFPQESARPRFRSRSQADPKGNRLRRQHEGRESATLACSLLAPA